jgi:hypothetical protein
MPLFGNIDNANSKPKWLSSAEKAETFFVSVEEAQLATNKAKGITGAGWYKLTSKVGADGTKRNFAECLVAMSILNVTSGDAADDAYVADAELAFTTQPSGANVTAPAASSFTVVVDPSAGATYQWQVKVGAAYVNVTDAGVYTNATTATLNISDSTGLSGNKYRVVVTNAATTAVVTSKPATLTAVEPTFAALTQAVNRSVTAPAATTFGPVAVVAGIASTSYQWQVKVGAAAYVNVTNAGVYTGATTATLSISDSTGLDGNMYQCVATNNTSGAVVTFDAKTLTVA